MSQLTVKKAAHAKSKSARACAEEPQMKWFKVMICSTQSTCQNERLSRSLYAGPSTQNGPRYATRVQARALQQRIMCLWQLCCVPQTVMRVIKVKDTDTQVMLQAHAQQIATAVSPGSKRLAVRAQAAGGCPGLRPCRQNPNMSLETCHQALPCFYIRTCLMKRLVYNG